MMKVTYKIMFSIDDPENSGKFSEIIERISGGRSFPLSSMMMADLRNSNININDVTRKDPTSTNAIQVDNEEYLLEMETIAPIKSIQ